MIPFHPLADIFPLMQGADFDALVASVKQNGQREPVILLEGSILDGRNRYRACLAAGIEPRCQKFMNGDPLAFVLDHNLHRRHLNESQRAVVAAKLANLRNGQTKGASSRDEAPVSQADAAAWLNVGKSTVERAAIVLNSGTEEQIADVVNGRVRVGTVAKQINKQNKKKDEDKNGRQKTHQMQAAMWNQFRAGLENLTSLPLPEEVLKVSTPANKAAIVDKRLKNALTWLKEFSHAWNHRND